MELLIYSPNRPLIDFSLVFLWMMSVGTVLSASLWSEIVGSDEHDESNSIEQSPKVLSMQVTFSASALSIRTNCDTPFKFKFAEN